MKEKLVITNHVSEDRLAEITALVPGTTVVACETRDDALMECVDATALALWGAMDPTEFLARGPNIRWLHSLSAGVEALLTPAVVAGDILLTNARHVHDAPVAERAIAFILALAHRFPEAMACQKTRTWKRLRFEPLAKKTVLIVGFGGIGKEIARRTRALGMHVVAAKRTPCREPLADEVVTDSIFPYLGDADFVVCALPATDRTQHYFRAAHFAAMKKSACFINIARGSLVDEEALIDALRSGTIAGAGLDVFETEPLPDSSPLWTLPNVLITAHCAFLYNDSFERSLRLLAANWLRFNRGEPLYEPVNKQQGY